MHTSTRICTCTCIHPTCACIHICIYPCPYPHQTRPGADCTYQPPSQRRRPPPPLPVRPSSSSPPPPSASCSPSTPMYVYVSIIYIYTSIYVCMYVCMYVCKNLCLDVSMCVCMYTVNIEEKCSTNLHFLFMCCTDMYFF